MEDIGTISEARMDASFFEWKIPEFLSLPDNEKEYFSPSFSFSGSKWYFSVFPKGDEGFDEWLSLYLIVENPCTIDTTVTFALNVKKSDGKLEEKEDHPITYTFKNYYSYYNLVKFLSLDDLETRKSELLPSGVLTLTLRIWNCCPPSEVDAREPSKFVELETLSSDLNDLFIDQKSCDATLKVKGREFQVHRSLLIARSSVFAAMFENAMTEQETGIVDVPDCDPESFGDFLKYLYTGKLKDISCESARHLYVTADKYDVQQLKSFCAKYIEQNLCQENFCDVLGLANLYGESKLMSSLQMFFNENAEQIVSTSEWETLMGHDNSLANKLLREMFKSKVLVSKIGHVKQN